MIDAKDPLTQSRGQEGHMLDPTHRQNSGNMDDRPSAVVPFGVNFEVRHAEEFFAAGGTNTTATNDDDTGTFRNDTEDADT